MNFIITLLLLLQLTIAIPAHVKIVTETRIVTVINGPNGLETKTEGQAVATEAATEVTEAATTEVTEAATTEAATTEAATTEAATTSMSTPTETQIEPAEETTSTTSTSSTSSSLTSTSEPTSGSGEKRSGEGTYYQTGLGACGETSSNSDYIVAVSHSLFDETDTGNPNNNPICGRKVKAFYEGKSVEATVVDRCEGCAHDDLDFSPSAFTSIADKSLGRIDIKWEFIN